MKLNLKLNRKILQLSLAFGVIIIGSNSQVKAQDDVAQLMKAGVDDAGKLADAYMSPLLKGFGAGLNGGWYNTAKPHGLGRFDITFHLNAVFIPEVDKVFDANTLGFNKLRVKSGTGPQAPTVSGSDNFSNPAVYELYLDNPLTGTPSLVTDFQSPQGTGLPYSGAPTVQLAVGLIKKTELMIRYMPTVALGNVGDAGLFGFGLKHDVKQWIPVVDKLPFDLSAYFGYTKFNLDKSIELNPEANVPNRDGNVNTDYSNQMFNIETKATTFGLLLSKKLAVLTLYSGLQYQRSTSTLALNGNYPVTIIEDRLGANNYGQEVIESYKDPVSFEVEGANGMTATLGARLKLLVLTLDGSYTFGQYPYASIGVGLNIDWK